MSLQDIRCVLFDLDGVLLDAREIHYEALNKALQEFGYEPISRKDHEEKYNGLPTGKKLQMLGIKDGRINPRKQELTLEGIRNLPPDHTKHELMQLPLSIGVCTNSVYETLKVALDWMGLVPDLALSNEDIKRNKPHPDIYLLAMSNLNTMPLRTLIVEDSQYGIDAARKSGAHLMIVNDPSEVTLETVTSAINCCTGSRKRVEIQASGLFEA